MENNREVIDKLIMEFQKKPTIEKINEIIEVEPSLPAFYYKADLLIQDKKYDEAEEAACIGYKIALDISENAKDEAAVENAKHMQETFICMLDYLYSESKQFDKLINGFAYKDKTKEEVLEYIKFLGDSEKDLDLKAFSYRVIGEMQGEENCRLEAVKKYPKSFFSNYNIAEFYRIIRKTDMADKYYDIAIKIEPENTNAIHAKGFNLESVDPDKSIECYKKVLEIDNEAIGTLLNIGRLLTADKKDLNGAMEHLNKAIKLQPDFTLAYVARANTKDFAKDYEGALEDANKAMELNPMSVEAYEFKAKVLNHLERYQDSIDVICNAENMENFELSCKAYYFRAVAYEALGNLDDAIIDAKIAKAENYIEAFNLLGKIYFKQKEYDKALEEINIVLQFDNKNEIAGNILKDIQAIRKEDTNKEVEKPKTSVISRLCKGFFKK